ncbi:MAG: hypothetical protein ACRCZS_04120 [Chroococcidiopsis sp.]
MTQADIYDRIAKSALEQYGLDRGQCCFLGHSGNVTFRVETQQGKFLLRIHQAISSSHDDVWQKPEVIESELLWLAALHHDTKLVVQKPIINLQDRWVTPVNNPQEHEGVSDTVKEVAKEHIPLYLQGESFLFDKY